MASRKDKKRPHGQLGIKNFFKSSQQSDSALDSGAAAGSSSQDQVQPEVPEPAAKASKPASETSKDTSVKLSTVQRWKLDKKDDLSWLEYTATDGRVTKVFCSHCKSKKALIIKTKQQHGQSHIADIQAFLEGTTNLRKTNMIRHANSVAHQLAKEAVEVEKMNPEDRPIEQAISKVAKRTFDRLEKLFDIAYYIANEELAFTKFATLIALEKRHGVQLGDAYATNGACKTFIKYCAETVREGVLKNLISPNTKYRYHSIFSDGTTDKTVAEREVVYVKLLENGEAKMKYLGLVDVKHADATHVKEALYDLYQEEIKSYPSASTGIIGAGADGASVNFGIHRGMIQQIRDDQLPWLVGVHCIAHRLELAVKDALKDSYLTKEIDLILRAIQSFYSMSPKRMRELKTIAESTGERTVAYQRLDGTRWVAHHLKALRAFVHNFIFLLQHLEDVCSPQRKDVKPTVQATMKGWLKKMLTTKFVLACSYYIDVLAEVTAISETFQRSDISMQETIDRLTTAYTRLRQMETSGFDAGISVSATLKLLKEDGNGKAVYKDFVLTDLAAAKGIMETMNEDTIAKTLACLEERFRDFEDNPLFDSCTIFDPTSWPSETDPNSNMMTFGNDKLEFLLDHFHVVLESQGCDLEAAKREWANMKLYVSKHPHMVQVTYTQFWQKFFASVQLQSRFSNILHMVAIMLVYPISNAELERAFSTMNRILTDWRKRLLTSTLNDLLAIKQAGPPPADFKSGPAVKAWLLGCRRRPVARKIRKGKEDDGDDDGERPGRVQVVEGGGGGDDEEEEMMEVGDEEDEEEEELQVEVDERDLEVGDENEEIVVIE